jgi:acyl-CoA reductase-like NAD-dependent aldehyde dehydrogenase
VRLNRLMEGHTLREPIGVCALITSYNYPLVLTSWKLAPALACGNVCVVKPHEQTPLSALYLAQLSREYCDLPEGVLSVLPGGAGVGRDVVGSDCVQKVSFTGSPGVGRLLLTASAETNLKRVTLELGGKSPAIVFGDVDGLDGVVDDLVGAIFANAGQNCCAGSRLYIQKGPIYDLLLEKLKAKTEALIVGDPFDGQTQIGPIVNRQQYEKILAFVETAKQKGHQVLTGGKPHSKGGTFIEPTIFTNVSDDDDLACQEIFGPVLSIMKPYSFFIFFLSYLTE